MALPELDAIWIECARALEIPISRGGESYVHFDGTTLHLADARELDADDSIAQLVLHEICHLLVQGDAHRHTPDWGLHNTGGPETELDEMRERAAVRLQAHLASGFGLRARFFPTTSVRPFYEALPLSALRDPADPSAELAREAATRAGHAPYRQVLVRALAASARALAVDLHRSGAALAEALRCGGCAWREPSGLCRAAERRIFVAVDELGCSRREVALDCLACGACCRSGYDAVPARPRDAIVRKHPELVIARDDAFDLRRKVVGDEDRCVALDGDPAGPYRCRAYADRPRACADLPAGGAACLQARRRVGLSLG